MTEPVSPIDPESSLPAPTRLRILWLGLSTLALLAVVGAVWAGGWQDVTHPQPAAAVLAEDDHAAASTHSEAEAHETKAHEAAAHEDEANTSDEHGGDHPPASTEHDAGDAHAGAAEHASGDEHGAVAEHEHAEAGGHGSEAAPVSAQTKQIVLSGVAGINLLVVLAAAFFRRQNPPRLPKYLQPLKQGSQP